MKAILACMKNLDFVIYSRLQPIKIFFMESFLNILPVRKNLQRRGLFEGARCVYCGCCWFEDDRYALFYCYFAKQV